MSFGSHAHHAQDHTGAVEDFFSSFRVTGILEAHFLRQLTIKAVKHPSLPEYSRKPQIPSDRTGCQG